MISSQMLKGTLEGCVLTIISQKKTYGYEISDQLMAYGFGKIRNNTIYPLLNRLEKKELITSTYQASELGPKRKYYALTPQGEQTLADFLRSYHELTDAVQSLLLSSNEGQFYRQIFNFIPWPFSLLIALI